MNRNRTAERTLGTAATGVVPLVAAGVAAGATSLVAVAVVFASAAPSRIALAALAAWVPLMVLFAAVDADPGRLWRFVLVFYGSLIGLTLLVDRLVGTPALDAALVGLQGLEFAVAVNPVMTILVGGALALSYYGVFEWTDGTDRRA